MCGKRPIFVKDINTMQVDINEVIAAKNPKLAKRLPGFVTAWLKRILHQDEINLYLEKFGGLSPIDFDRACLREMGVTYTVEGLDKLDPNGRYLLASNHPFGGMDGLMLADKVEEKFGEMRIIVNDILMNLTPLAPLFVPVNKHGRQNPGYARMLAGAFESDMPLITFPAGLCSRRIKGKVQDPPWKTSFVKKAAASGRDIVPVFCEGRLSNFFYRLSNLRKALGIKANIEMLYLPDEMFAQKGKHFRIIVGDPIPAAQLTTAPPKEWTGEIRQIVYSLAEKP